MYMRICHAEISNIPSKIYLIGNFIENTMLVLLISSLSGETRNSVGMARIAEPFQCVSGRA